MRLYKILVLLLMMVVFSNKVYAYDNLWFDRQANIDLFRKIVVYPIAIENRYNYQWDNLEPFASYNYELHKRLTRHIKNVKFYELFKTIDEKKELVSGGDDKNKILLNRYDVESERANKIKDAFEADGYITTFYREKRMEIDHSPEVWNDVHLFAYTKETGGPNGSRIYDNSDWWEHHCTPAKDLNRYISTLEFTLYNDYGKEIFTCVNSSNSYKKNHEQQFKELKDDFVDNLKDVRNGKYDIKLNENVHRKMYSEIIHIPDNKINDNHFVNAVNFTLDRISNKLKNVACVYDKNNISTDYYITIDIKKCEYNPEWKAPYADSYTDCVWSKERKWVDNNGNEHTMKIQRYVDKIKDHFGYYDVDHAVKLTVTMKLYNAHTQELLGSCDYNTTNDKEMDAFIEILNDFYAKVDKFSVGKYEFKENKPKVTPENFNTPTFITKNKDAKQVAFSNFSASDAIDIISSKIKSNYSYEIKKNTQNENGDISAEICFSNGNKYTLIIRKANDNKVQYIDVCYNLLENDKDRTVEVILALLDDINLDIKTKNKFYIKEKNTNIQSWKIKNSNKRIYMQSVYDSVNCGYLDRFYLSEE